MQPLQICIGSTIRIGQGSWCLPYAGFFLLQELFSVKETCFVQNTPFWAFCTLFSGNSFCHKWEFPLSQINEVITLWRCASGWSVQWSRTTRRYGPLRGSTSSSFGGFLLRLIVLFWPILGHFWESIVTLVTLNSNLYNFEKIKQKSIKKRPIYVFLLFSQSGRLTIVVQTEMEHYTLFKLHSLYRN